MTLKGHGRYGYMPITRRSADTWPNGTRLAVYFVVGVEEYAFGEGMTENIIPGSPQPDLVNTSWRDYGNRVGGFRILDKFEQSGVPLSILLNSEVYDHAPALTDAFRAAGCPVIAHGLSNSDCLSDMNEADEAAYLTRTRRRIAEVEGKAPMGWSSPWLAHSARTIDLLAENGYGYVLDFGLDERPVWLRARSGRLLHIPYALELNDSATEIGRFATGRDFAGMIVDQFDEMLATADQPLVMSVVVHSFITGQPFRLRPFAEALDHIRAKGDAIWLTTPDAIYESVKDSPELAV